jgi:hypothetical protein
MFRVVTVLISFLVISSTYATAGVCDYRPSQVLGAGATAAVIGGTGTAAAAGGAAKAIGVYTLVHATSGATMVGGTWAGASAAGTAGIIGGTAGVIGSAVAVVTAPVTIIAAGVAAASVATYEGACYFSDTRITDYAEVDAIVADIAVTAPPIDFKYLKGSQGARNGKIWVRSPEGFDVYEISDLYIENGVLKVSGWGPNRTIGIVAAMEQQ